MLIPYNKIVEKYNLNIKTVLHIGAHKAEEHDDYFNNGCEEVVWVEANPKLCSFYKIVLMRRKT